MPGEVLKLYLGASEVAPSFVLVIETEHSQQPVYYVSKVMIPAKQHYLPTKKLTLTSVIDVHKLRSYFHAHTIVVMIDQPIKQVMRKPELLGCMVKWAIKLSEFDVLFEPRGTIEAQALADFIAENTSSIEARHASHDTWELLTYESSTSHKTGDRCVLIPPSGCP